LSKEERMRDTEQWHDVALFAGLGLGAGLIYLLDPESGRRLRGLAHAAGRRLRQAGLAADDAVLRDHVRGKLGRLVAYPEAIEVVVEDGIVTLRGSIPAHEVDHLLRAVVDLPGVYDVISEVEVHDGPPGETRELPPESWSPAARCVGGSLGGGLALYGAARCGWRGSLTAALGLGILLRAASNMSARRLTGIGAGRRAVELHRNIHIARPVEEVFAAWSHYGNFPFFMSHVREVRAGQDGRSHWVVDGPAGMTVHWEAVLTRFEPPSVLAWKTVEGSPFPNAGIVHFTPQPSGGTDVDVQLSYNPPGGALGHVLAVMLGADPRRRMESDLMRMKAFLEARRPPYHEPPAAEPTPEVVAT
jgi:uncharacterized membrane protein